MRIASTLGVKDVDAHINRVNFRQRRLEKVHRRHGLGERRPEARPFIFYSTATFQALISTNVCRKPRAIQPFGLEPENSDLEKVGLERIRHITFCMGRSFSKVNSTIDFSTFRLFYFALFRLYFKLFIIFTNYCFQNPNA